jgi:protoporphyrinogen oxidase
MTDEGILYLECLFSPTPITNSFEVQPMEFDSVAMVSSALPKPKPVLPVRFWVYVDIDEMKAFDRWDWGNYKNKKTSNNEKLSMRRSAHRKLVLD